jgi:proteasome lid subunit RPN8/RPN11
VPTTKVCAVRLLDGLRYRGAWLVLETSWTDLLGELGERGGGYRESGAFLLGDLTGSRARARAVVYYDDLDPSCLTGGISFSGTAYGALWDACERLRLGVVGDVHTHPAVDVRQSATDKAHPMLPQAGHIALIVPHFARRSSTPEDVGVHRYEGDGRWAASRNPRRHLRLGRKARN